MLLKILSPGFILGLFSINAFAGSNRDHGHSHSHAPVNHATANTNAAKIVSALVKRNKLDNTWASISASSVEKKLFQGKQGWVVVYVNDKITDSDKRTLYIYLTLGGDYIAANYTGE